MAKKATLDPSKVPSNCLPLVKQLQVDHPYVIIKTGKRFSYRPPKTVILGPPQPYFALQTLHELGHALSGHKDWSTGVSRLKCEREAWERAETLFFQYQNLIPADTSPEADPTVNNKTQQPLSDLASWDEDFVEASLDTYRNWLHLKTICPRCGLTRFQSEDGTYHCPHCENFI